MDTGTDPGAPDPLPWNAKTERCNNQKDDDGDGFVDEDCSPGLWAGLFPPGAGQDFSTAHFTEGLEAAANRKLPVIQTYRATKAFDIPSYEPDLAAIWAHGSAAHLNVEPGGYTLAQYANAASDPEIDTDLKAVAAAITNSLVAHPRGLAFVTFGAEMNGGWTDWGCLAPATYVAFYRKAHDLLAQEVSRKSVDARRVRWAYGPNAVSFCGSSVDYYPGHAYVDYLGLSAYRQGSETVDTSVIAPAKALLAGLGYLPAWQRDRVIVLQTAVSATNTDRSEWIADLYAGLLADPVFAGVIYFSTDDGPNQYALAAETAPLLKRMAYDAWVSAVAPLPASDPRLEASFEPYFWDVSKGDPYYPEIQSLRAAHAATGCGTEPPRFCGADPLRRADATGLLMGAFKTTWTAAQGALPGGLVDHDTDAVTADMLAIALSTLSSIPRAALSRSGRIDACATVATCAGGPISRANGAAWIVRTANLAPAPAL